MCWWEGLKGQHTHPVWREVAERKEEAVARVHSDEGECCIREVARGVVVVSRPSGGP